MRHLEESGKIEEIIIGKIKVNKICGGWKKLIVLETGKRSGFERVKKYKGICEIF